MRLIIRLGDTSSHAGVVITSANTVDAEGPLVARLGDLHICPIPGHGITPIVTASLNVTVEGRPVARLFDLTGCGAALISGATHTMVN